MCSTPPSSVPKYLRWVLFEAVSESEPRVRPVETAVKRNQLVAPCGIARQLNRAFHRLCAAIAEEYLVVVRLRHGGDEALRQLRHVTMIEIRAGNVDEFRRLLLNGLHHMRVAMARRADRDARGKIQGRCCHRDLR